MIWPIAKKEVLVNLITFKFAMCTALCVVLTAIFSCALIYDYKQRLKNYNKNLAINEMELRKVKVYKNITPTIYLPPTLLSVFSEGMETQVNNSAKIELGSIPKINVTSTETNPYLSIFPKMDVVLVIKIVISIMVLLIAYDTISGEREQGTLKLMLAGTLSRYQLLLGKLLGGLIILVIPLTIVFMVAVLTFLLSPMVDLTGSNLVRIGLIYFVSLIFISMMHTLGLLLSCLTKKPSTSLIFVLLFWIIFTIVIPNTSRFVAIYARPVESEEKIDNQVELLWQKFKGEVQEYKNKHPRKGDRYGAEGAFGQIYWPVCNKDWIETYKKYYSFEEPLKIRYANKVAQIQQNYLSNLFKQKHFAINLSSTSPISIYENIVSSLSGTGIKDIQCFVEHVEAYRNKVINYIRYATDNFSSSTYFTQSEGKEWEEGMKFFEKFKQTKKQADREEAVRRFIEWGKKKAVQTPSLNYRNFPKFSFEPYSITETIKRIVFEMFLLIFAVIVFLALSFIALLRYDIR